MNTGSYINMIQSMLHGVLKIGLWTVTVTFLLHQTSYFNELIKGYIIITNENTISATIGIEEIGSISGNNLFGQSSR
jgi:hypothetical protein